MVVVIVILSAEMAEIADIDFLEIIEVGLEDLRPGEFGLVVFFLADLAGDGVKGGGGVVVCDGLVKVADDVVKTAETLGSERRRRGIGAIERHGAMN